MNESISQLGVLVFMLPMGLFIVLAAIDWLISRGGEEQSGE